MSKIWGTKPENVAFSVRVSLFEIVIKYCDQMDAHPNRSIIKTKHPTHRLLGICNGIWMMEWTSNCMADWRGRLWDSILHVTRQKAAKNAKTTVGRWSKTASSPAQTKESVQIRLHLIEGEFNLWISFTKHSIFNTYTACQNECKRQFFICIDGM